jgi:phosphohistidine phosphatase
MDLYILRHGEAEPRGQGVAEANRELTRKGIKDVRSVVAWAHTVKVAPALILTSSLSRARHTAKLAAKSFVAEIRETPALLPDAKPELLWAEIRALEPMQQLMIVGHNPHLQRFAAYLLGSQNVDIKKAGLLRITVDQPPAAPAKSKAPQPPPVGVLKWMITPGLVR